MIEQTFHTHDEKYIFPTKTGKVLYDGTVVVIESLFYRVNPYHRAIRICSVVPNSVADAVKISALEMHDQFEKAAHDLLEQIVSAYFGIPNLDTQKPSI